MYPSIAVCPEICDTYGLIDNGALLATGGMEALCALINKGLTVSFNVNGRTIETKVETEEEIPHIVKKYVENGDAVYHVAARRLSLEEIYFTLIEQRRGNNG